MTELQAEQGAPALDVPHTEAKPRRNRDALIALAVFVVLALLPMVFSSAMAF